MSANILQPDNIILGGDLNFSLGLSESWGHHAQVDPLLVFFENLLDLHNLIDIPSAKLVPTWRNRRSGEDSLARRLDHFLIKERFLEQGFTYRQWVGSSGLSDHLLIYLDIRGDISKP